MDTQGELEANKTREVVINFKGVILRYICGILGNCGNYKAFCFREKYLLLTFSSIKYKNGSVFVNSFT